MASGKGTYLENIDLDAHLGSGNPPFIYVHLWTILPGRDRTGGVEVAGGIGYSPLMVANDGTTFPAASDGVKYNGIAFDFGVALAPGWGSVVGMTYDDDVNNLLYYGAFTTPVTVNTGAPFVIAAGNATVMER